MTIELWHKNDPVAYNGWKDQIQEIIRTIIIEYNELHKTTFDFPYFDLVDYTDINYPGDILPIFHTEKLKDNDGIRIIEDWKVRIIKDLKIICRMLNCEDTNLSCPGNKDCLILQETIRKAFL